MIILALDQASCVSGYSIFQDGKLKDFGHFSVGSTKPLPMRLHMIREKVLQLIEEWHPDKLYIEDIQMQKNVANNVVTFKALAEVIGVLSEMAYSISLPFEIISSNTWKSYLKITGSKRQEQKKNAQIYISNKYNVKPTQDEADAVCIGEYAASLNSNPNDWTT